ncbi:MAG: hypothetical protein NVS2B5_25070 [Beijerinckiaceae bacterium]
MSETDLDALERDVVASRERLVSRVAEVRSPRAVANLKDSLVADATEFKDEAIARGKQTLSQSVDDMLAGLKRRAAANPAAVAAIGAGIAWRLWQKPPVATLLVGAGLATLLGRTPVHEIDVDPYDPDHPASYVPGGVAGYGYGPQHGVLARKAIGGATVLAGTARATRAGLRETVHDLRDQAAELKDNVLQSAGELKDSVVETAGELKDSVIGSSTRAVRTVSSTAAQAGDRFEMMRDSAGDTVRDNSLYFGIAALALGAAAGIGWAQRGRHEDFEDAEDV